LTYSEAEPIVDSTLLKSKHLSNRLGGAFDWLIKKYTKK
jgi:hypothetical protein